MYLALFVLPYLFGYVLEGIWSWIHTALYCAVNLGSDVTLSDYLPALALLPVKASHLVIVAICLEVAFIFMTNVTSKQLTDVCTQSTPLLLAAEVVINLSLANVAI